MTSAARWTLRILGWVLVVLALMPHYEVSKDAGRTTTMLTFGLGFAPIFRSTDTVIDAGVAGVPEAVKVTWSKHFDIASLSMLCLIVGALIVSATNRRPGRTAP